MLGHREVPTLDVGRSEEERDQCPTALLMSLKQGGSGESSGTSAPPPLPHQLTQVGGGLQCLGPNPAGMGSGPHTPASGWVG